eukprot:8387403-Alexandrium_andersonii.AAC.1
MPVRSLTLPLFEARHGGLPLDAPDFAGSEDDMALPMPGISVSSVATEVTRRSTRKWSSASPALGRQRFLQCQ